LFLAVSCVMMLLQRDRNNTDERTLHRLRREDAIERTHPDNILRKSAKLLTPFILLFALYVLFNGENSPGGGFSGGAILGGGLILYSAAYGPEQLSRLLTRRLYDAVRITGLMAYALTYGIFIFAGANGITAEMDWMMTVIDLAVGLVVACTIHGFYTMYQRGKL
jgi:multicomponent Na+:H+ antiporter subunit B